MGVRDGNLAAVRWRLLVEQPVEPDRADFVVRLRASLSAEFVRTDRRRVTPLPEATLDEFVKHAVITHYELGTRPRTVIDRVVEVRGDCLTLVDSRLVWGDAAQLEYLAVIRFDERVEMVDRMVMFDGDNVVAAITELEQQNTAMLER